MAAMVRTLGVPARVGVGFTPGAAQADGSYQVTTNDAHAWPEVWFSGHGWVRFEPTPRAEQVTTPGYSVPPSADDVPEPTQGEVPTAAPQTPAPEAVDPTDPGNRLEEDAAAAGGDQGGTGALTPARAGLSAAVLLLLAAPALLAALRRRHRWREPSPQAAWAQVVEDAADVGHRWDPTASPRTAAERLVREQRLSGEGTDVLRALAARVEQARYARPDAAATGSAEELRAAVGGVRAGLLAAAPPRVRWRARLLPASTLRWAATRTGTLVADALDRVDEVTSAAGARLRRRRRPV
jgi:hypothetical protein